MSRTNFVSVFEGTVEEVADYIRENYSGREWDCPTGRENTEGIIEVLESGALDAAQHWDETVMIEMDGIGNIRCVGDMEVFASIVQEDD